MLAREGEQSLGEMRNALVVEIETTDEHIAELRAELRFVETALTMAQRAERSSDGNGVRVSRDDVLLVMSENGGLTTPSGLVAAFESQGVDISRQSAHNHLSRLANDGLVLQMDNGHYATVG